MRSNAVAVIILFLGISFTLWAGAAWARGRRLAAMVLAVVAVIDISLAINLLSRYYG